MVIDGNCISMVMYHHGDLCGIGLHGELPHAWLAMGSKGAGCFSHGKQRPGIAFRIMRYSQRNDRWDMSPCP